MILRDDANQYNSLYHYALWWARTDASNFTFDEFIRCLNLAVNSLAALIQRHDATWNWKDSNAVDGSLIDAETDLVADVSSYPVSTPWRAIARVRMKDRDGNFRTLERVDRRDVTDDQLISPDIRNYFLLGGNLYLAGKPTYGQTDGIEVQFKTGATPFVPADTGESVGFDPTFEELAALMPALSYLEVNGPDEQARKVEKRIGIEPREGMEGAGLLNSLALAYQQRSIAPNSLSIKGSNRATGLL